MTESNITFQNPTNVLTIAVPKGRLQSQVFSYFETRGIHIENPERQLIIEDASKSLRILLVKNSDLPEYVNAGIATVGVIGTDIVEESPYSFFSLGFFPFGSTKICLISKPDEAPINNVQRTTIATKYTKFTKNFLKERNINAQLIKLNGSVEIAPLLGLAPYIIDLVETGNTIKENGLSVLEEIGTTRATLIANKALYKLNYKAIEKVVRNLNL